MDEERCSNCIWYEPFCAEMADGLEGVIGWCELHEWATCSVDHCEDHERGPEG